MQKTYGNGGMFNWLGITMQFIDINLCYYDNNERNLCNGIVQSSNRYSKISLPPKTDLIPNK